MKCSVYFEKNDKLETKVAGLPSNSPAIHLHGFCGVPNLRGYSTNKLLTSEAYISVS